MGGLAVLWLTAVYLLIAIWATYRAHPHWMKLLVALGFLLLPTADAVYGRIKLRQMCAAEGGLKVYKTVEGVEGLYVGRFRPDPTWITNYGYRFIEGKDSSGKYRRLSRGPDGKIIEEKDVVPKSRYQLEYLGGDFGAGYAYDEQRIRDLQTNEILARARNISYEGGWAERFIAMFSDSGSGFAGACQEGSKRIWSDQIAHSALKPIQK